jgi:hypothetical protein
VPESDNAKHTGRCGNSDVGALICLPKVAWAQWSAEPT